MKNLIPQFTIGAIGLIGLAWKGLWGLVLGLGVGYLAVVAFGLMLTTASGGLLPKKLRRETANNFCRVHAEDLPSLVPRGHEGREAEFIEELLERVIKRAAVTSSSTASGMSYAEIETAISDLQEEESDGRTKLALTHLWGFLRTEWYQDFSATT